MISCPEEHKKGRYLKKKINVLFLSLKRRKKQNRVCHWEGTRINFAIERVELLQLCFTFPLVYFLVIVLLGGRESSQNVLMGAPGSAPTA